MNRKLNTNYGIFEDELASEGAIALLMDGMTNGRVI